MSKKISGVNYGKTVPQQSRRSRAKDALESQLKRGTKPVKKSLTETLPLTDKDIKRIKGEIERLKIKMR